MKDKDSENHLTVILLLEESLWTHEMQHWFGKKNDKKLKILKVIEEK